MKKETINIALLVTGLSLFCVLMPTYPLAGILLLGVLMIWGSRWSRKKYKEFQVTEVARTHKNKLEGKPIIEQLKSKETWEKVKDGMSYHDPSSDKAIAIRNDVIGTLGTVPFAIIIIMAFGLMILLLYFFV